jgi:hypothetical protein
MTEIEYIERMIEITQERIDKVNVDLVHHTAELNMLLGIKSKLRKEESKLTQESEV